MKALSISVACLVGVVFGGLTAAGAALPARDGDVICKAGDYYMAIGTLYASRLQQEDGQICSGFGQKTFPDQYSEEVEPYTFYAKCGDGYIDEVQDVLDEVCPEAVRVFEGSECSALEDGLYLVQPDCNVFNAPLIGED